MVSSRSAVGIVDVFPPTEEHPLRVEFWGDDVEEIRSFSVADQRTLEKVERLWAPPCRELLLTDEVRASGRPSSAAAHPQLVELTDKIAAGIAVEGMESLAPVLVEDMELLVDLMPADTHVLVLDPERARSRAHDLVATSEEFLGASWAAAAGGGTAPIDLGAASYQSLGAVREHALGRELAWWSVSPFGLGDLDTDSLVPRESYSINEQRSSTRLDQRERSLASPLDQRERWPAQAGGVLPRGPGEGDRRHRGLAAGRLPGGDRARRATVRPSGCARCSPSTTYPPGVVEDIADRRRPERRRRHHHLRRDGPRLRRRDQPDRAC